MKNDKITEGVIKPLESPMGMQLQVNVFSLRTVLRTQTLIWRCNIFFAIFFISPLFPSRRRKQSRAKTHQGQNILLSREKSII